MTETSRNRKPRAVIFFGADGTGKSTQAAMLLREFNDRGVKARSAWLRGRHSVSYLVSQFLIKLTRGSIITVGDNPQTRILDTRSLPGRWLWSLLEFVSVIPWMITRVHLPLLLGYRVVAERYVIDTVVWNGYFIGSSFKPYGRILLGMMPRDAVLIHMDAEREDVFSRRRGDILSEGFMDYQLVQYRLMASRLGALSINTSDMGIEEVGKVIARAYEAGGT